MIRSEEIPANYPVDEVQKQNATNTVLSEGGLLLTSTCDVLRRWKEYFLDLSIPSTCLPRKKLTDLGNGLHITGAEVAEVE